ncbi:hypothetical protein HCH43_02830 [Klebsiella pneumoniae]|uniref:SGNH/GDSL hydrolase family protein n=2 Tax=Klebsiella pneumoniae TaxID=573 RepID=UPI001B8D8B73|nr:hypothetical protein [Klebsiella pneumoniae]MBX8862111.1 hypothetical protein [Klebsiella pneumoniae]
MANVPLPTPTDSPVPSTDIRDAVYAGAMLDKVVTSTDLKYTDRLGGEHYTVDGMKAEGDRVVEETRQNLIPLSRQYMTLAAAQADIANIPEGSTTYVRSADGNSLADEYINNGGTLQATGRKMPSREAVGEAETKPQFLSRELRSTETFHSSVIRTSNWTNATTSTWAVGSTSDGRVFNFIEMWVDGVSNIDSLKISVYSRSTDGASVFPGAEGDKLLLSKTVNMGDVAIKSAIATGYQLIRLVFDDIAVPTGKTALFVVQPFDASGNPVYMGSGRKDIPNSETAALSNSLGGFWMPVDQSGWRLATIPGTSLYRIAYQLGYENHVVTRSPTGDRAVVGGAAPNSSNWTVTTATSSQFYGWAVAIDGADFNCITLRHSNLSHVARIHYRVVARRAADAGSTAMPGVAPGDIQVYSGVVTPDAGDDYFRDVDYLVPVKIPDGYFAILVVYPQDADGGVAFMGTMSHDYSLWGETPPTGYYLGASIRKLENIWAFINGNAGIGYVLSNVAEQGVLDATEVHSREIAELAAEVSTAERQAIEAGAGSLIRPYGSDKFGYKTQTLGATFFRWAYPVPVDMKTLYSLDVWLDGVVLNHSLKVTVYGRSLSEKTNSTAPGALSGDIVLHQDTLLDVAKDDRMQKITLPFDLSIPGGSFPIVAVEAFLPDGEIGYLGAGAAIYTSGLPVIGQRGWYSRRGINDGAWSLISDGQVATVAFAARYDDGFNARKEVSVLSGRINALPESSQPGMLPKWSPVVTQDGLTLDFTGSSVVVDRVSYPFAGTVTLDSTPLEYGPVNNYTLRPAAANSQWPSNPNAWIGRKRVSNVVVTDVATGNTLTPGVEYNVDGYGGKLRGLTTATYTVNMTLNYLNERYDLIQIDPITLELSVVKGTIRIFDVQEYRPAVQAGKVPLFYALVAGSTVELEPVYRWPETGYDLQGNTDADLLRLHNRRCLQKTLARLNQGKPITLLGYGDSITAVSNIASPDTTPNGSTRDLQRILQGYATDTLTNFYPAQDWGDGGGAVHVKIGWNWRLKEWMESTFGVEVNYQNLGVSGTNSSSGAGSTRLNAAKATSPHVAVVCFGMNDNAGSTLYSNLMTIIAGLKSVGSDVVLMPVPRTPSHEDGRYTLDQWRYMNSQVYRAAMDGGAAYVPANWLTDDNSRGGMGIVPTSLCGSDLRNHPGGYEFSVYGKALVNTFC